MQCWRTTCRCRSTVHCSRSSRHPGESLPSQAWKCASQPGRSRAVREPIWLPGFPCSPSRRIPGTRSYACEWTAAVVGPVYSGGPAGADAVRWRHPQKHHARYVISSRLACTRESDQYQQLDQGETATAARRHRAVVRVWVPTDAGTRPACQDALVTRRWGRSDRRSRAIPTGPTSAPARADETAIPVVSKDSSGCRDALTASCAC